MVRGIYDRGESGDEHADDGHVLDQGVGGLVLEGDGEVHLGLLLFQVEQLSQGSVHDCLFFLALVLVLHLEEHNHTSDQAVNWLDIIGCAEGVIELFQGAGFDLPSVPDCECGVANLVLGGGSRLRHLDQRDSEVGEGVLWGFRGLEDLDEFD